MDIYTILIDSMIDVAVNSQLFIITGAIFFSITVFWKREHTHRLTPTVFEAGASWFIKHSFISKHKVLHALHRLITLLAIPCVPR